MGFELELRYTFASLLCILLFGSHWPLGFLAREFADAGLEDAGAPGWQLAVATHDIDKISDDTRDEEEGDEHPCSCRSGLGARTGA